MEPERPIIYIHYGSNDYLRYTLDSARFFNNHKRTILLGDASTKNLCKVLNIEHHNFAEIPSCPELKEFDELYREIACKEFNRPYWLSFIFRRWYLMYAFCLSQGIESFWTFDSDTLIFTNLSEHEGKFKDLDGTSQCNGICLNGYIGNLATVKQYLVHTNQLFKSPSYIEDRVREAETVPNYYFNEMVSFNSFITEYRPKIIPARTIINGQMFDECLCQAHEMTLSEFGTKLILFLKGNFYFHHPATNTLVQTLTFNMSWISTEWISHLFFIAVDHLDKKEDPKEPVYIRIPGPSSLQSST